MILEAKKNGADAKHKFLVENQRGPWDKDGRREI